MNVPHEYPHGQVGAVWLGNAGVYERNRRMCLEQAERDRKAGNESGARDFESHAENWKRRRDDEQRREEMKQLNRRAHRRY